MENVDKEKQEYYDNIFAAAKKEQTEEFRDLFLQLHEYDQVEVFHLLYPENKERVESFLTPEEFAGVFEQMETEDQQEAVYYLSEAFLAKVFKELPDDVVGRFFSETEDLSSEKLQKLIQDVGQEYIEQLLSYEPETAGFIMTENFVQIHDRWTMKEVVDYLRKAGKKAETIYYLYVIDDYHTLVGVLSLRDVLLAGNDELVKNYMNPQVVSVPADKDQEEVAHIIQEYDLIALPVLDKENRIQGIVTVDDILDILEKEVTEDFNEFAAIRQEVKRKETPFSIARSRTPWIVLLLILGLFTGAIISSFEETLESVVLLAAFIPMVMATAGNVGMQSLVVAVRDLNTREGKVSMNDLLATIKNELSTGIMIGIFSGVLLFFTIWIFYRNIILSFIVSSSVLITVGVSTVIGSLIPMIMKGLKVDPAAASGPFITTIADVTGILIYFAVATALLDFL